MVAPYYEQDGITIYHGDCREILPMIEPGSIDLVLTDPPYFQTTTSYVGIRGEGYDKRLVGDLSILRGYFDGIIGDIHRLMAPHGTYYVFCDAKSYSAFHHALYSRCKHVRLCIWDKVVSYNGYTWRHQHELIAWGEMDDADRVPTGDGDILRFRGVRQKDRNHPAEKPTDLLVKLISKHTAPLILDPYMGSGSTLVAAKELGRRAIGIEIEERYCEIAAKRLQQSVLPMFADVAS